MQRVLGILISFGLSVVVWAGETISEGWLAKGTKWETPFYVRVSGKDGPTVVITGGIHGNEPAGARAAEQIRHWSITADGWWLFRRPISGTRDGTRFLPGEPPSRRDLNRQFPKTKMAAEAHGVLGKALWKFMATKIPIG